MKTPAPTALTRRRFVAGSVAAAFTLALGHLGLAGAQPTSAATFNSAMELAVTFTITPPDGGRWQRPYVAVWIENKAGQPLRTLSLWVEASGRGLRYVDHLTRWVQDTRANADLVQTVSSPTRNPGQYRLSWDGKTDQGKSVPLGDYFVCIEYAREHGPYDLIREPVTLGTAAFKKALTGNPEVAEVSVEYHKRA